MPFTNDRGELKEDVVIGRNAVLELLKTDRPIECIYLQKGISGTAAKIAAIAKGKGIVVKEAAAAKLDKLCANQAHQGVAARVSAVCYAEVEDLFNRALELDEQPFFVIADGIEDPHNLGAIIRSAEAAGAHGLILPKRRSAGLSFTVAKTSAGAVAHLLVARVSSIPATLDQLKKRGLWIYAADMDGENWCGLDYTGAVGLVVGSEGGGISRPVGEKCDYKIALPMRGKISSLNVSVAAGIICYEIARQRLGLKPFAPG